MSEPARPVVFDLTHVVSRLPRRPTSGIDRVDLAYADRFAGGATPSLHYGLRGPHVVAAAEAAGLVRLARSLWDSERALSGGEGFRAVRRWLAADPREALAKPPRRPAPRDLKGTLARHLQQVRGRLLHDPGLALPERAIYLNVAQHLFEHGGFFRWLGGRDDLCAVFMIHDLLPLDYPEYFSAANLGLFRRRIATALRHADAFLVSTRVVKARLEAELRAHGVGARPIHVQPFPSPLPVVGDGGGPAPGHPYFVVLGTIEPRKNHLTLLHVWRRLASRDPAAPRLVIVGARGWENEQVADILDRSPVADRHVLELTGLPSADLAQLILGARALLAPSFDEGYGLPVVEALSLGVPVVASDIPVFREIAQEHATFVSPLDGLGWTAAVERFAHDADFAADKRRQAARFRAPTWAAYFAAVQDFFASL